MKKRPAASESSTPHAKKPKKPKLTAAETEETPPKTTKKAETKTVALTEGKSKPAPKPRVVTDTHITPPPRVPLHYKGARVHDNGKELRFYKPGVKDKDSKRSYKGDKQREQQYRKIFEEVDPLLG